MIKELRQITPHDYIEAMAENRKISIGHVEVNVLSVKAYPLDKTPGFRVHEVELSNKLTLVFRVNIK